MSSRNYKWLSKPENFVCKIYSKQKSKSIERGHLPPEYTLQELRNYLMSKKEYISMFNRYIQSDRDKNLAPSIDRLNDDKGYSLGNIQLTTWGEHKCKPKKLLCHEILHVNNDGTETKYESISEAARCLNTSKQRIHKVVTGLTKKSKLGEFKKVIV